MACVNNLDPYREKKNVRLEVPTNMVIFSYNTEALGPDSAIMNISRRHIPATTVAYGF